MERDDLRVIKSSARLVGGMGFEGALVQVVEKATGDLYQQPCLVIATNMMSGEQNKPFVITTDMVMPMIANLSAWAQEVADMTMREAATMPEAPVLSPINDVKRLPGEPWQDWQDRLVRIAQDKQTDEAHAQAIKEAESQYDGPDFNG